MRYSYSCSLSFICLLFFLYLFVLRCRGRVANFGLGKAGARKGSEWEPEGSRRKSSNFLEHCHFLSCFVICQFLSFGRIGHEPPKNDNRKDTTGEKDKKMTNE